MQYSREDTDAQRIATLDIETTGTDAQTAETVAIGVGVHTRGEPGTEAELDCFYRDSTDDEAEIITDAADQLAEYQADRLVTFNGHEFDLPFLGNRLEELGVAGVAFPFSQEEHTDLFADRRADTGSWPKLEECVSAYGATPARTRWNDTVVDGGVFAEELAPAYLDGLASNDIERVDALRPVIEHYLESDLENNWLIYYGDLDEAFDPVYAGTENIFTTSV